MAKKLAPKKPAKSAVKSNSKLTYTGVGSWNKWLALLFAVQGICILLFSAVRSFPITVNYLGLDSLQTNAQAQTVLATGSQVWFNLNLAYVVGAFLIIAAIAHGLLASRLQKQYEKDLKSEINSIRWISFAVSVSLLTVTVALVAGVQDIASLLLVAGLTALMFVLALFAERQNPAGRTKWVLYWSGVAAGLLAWGAIKIYLLGGTIWGSVPAYIYWISIISFLLVAAVMINLFLQLRKYKSWKNYLYSERMYMYGSLVMYTLSAWLIYVAILRP